MFLIRARHDFYRIQHSIRTSPSEHYRIFTEFNRLRKSRRETLYSADQLDKRSRIWTTALGLDGP